MDLARSDRKHIVLPEGHDERILRAAAMLLEREVVDLTLLGDEAEIREAGSTSSGSSSTACQIIDPATLRVARALRQALHRAAAPKKTPPGTSPMT